MTQTDEHSPSPRRRASTRQPSERMRARMATTRQDIMDAALALFEETSVRDVSIARIMERAGYSVGTYYSFFKDKEDLICQAARDLMGKANAFLADVPEGLGPRTRIEYIVHGAAEVIAKNRSLFNLYMNTVALNPRVARERGSRHAEGSLALMRGIVEQGQALGEMRSDVPARIIASLIQGCLQSSVTQDPEHLVEETDLKLAFILDAMEPPASPVPAGERPGEASAGSGASAFSRSERESENGVRHLL